MLKYYSEKVKSSPLLKSGINFSIVGTIKSVVTMLIGILMMRWLSPKELGLWTAVSIFLSYLPFFQLGIQSSLNRELPILLGGNQTEKAEFIVKNSKGFAYVLFVLFILAGIILTTILLFLDKDKDFIYGMATISVMAAFSSVQLHLVATFRSAKAFNKLTLIYILNTIVIIGLIFFIYKFHYYGVLIYNLLSVVIVTILMYLMAPYRKLSPVLKFKELFNLSKIGIVLMSFIQLRELGKTIPKWIILFVGGTVRLGLFAPALAINGLMGMLPSQIAQFFHPQMGYKYGQSGNARDMWKYIKKMVIILPLASIPLCVGIWFATPWLLESFFPKYIESEWPMKIMSVAFIFSSAFTTHGVLYTIKAFKYAYVYSGIEVIGYLVLPLLANFLMPYDVLVNITIGIGVNNLILYILNIYLLKKVLFLPQYNKGIQIV